MSYCAFCGEDRDWCTCNVEPPEKGEEMVDIEEGKYEQLGEMDFTDVGDANVPVNIFLGPSCHEEDEDVEDGGWVLTASNFMPRKQGVSDEVFKFFSKDREVLVHMVQKHWKPLYENALERLKLEPDKDEKDGSASLYYWSKK